MVLDPAPTHVLAHLSDTHILAGGVRLHGVDTLAMLDRAMGTLEESGIRPNLIVHTGDIADLGDLEAYRLARDSVLPVARRLGSAVVWVAGNHDQRSSFRTALWGDVAADAAADGQGDAERPLDAVTTIDGLRVISLDSSVPGAIHGELDDSQLAWLARELAVPAPHGTVLALHHPPIPTQSVLLQAYQLREPERLARVVAGSDVRAILSGHLHYSSTGLLAGVPVFVAPATSYGVSLTAAGRDFVGVDAAQGMALLYVYSGSVISSVVPVGKHRVAVRLPEDAFDS